MSSQQTDRSSVPITFIRSPVEKHTSLPEISYTDPETESIKWTDQKNTINIQQQADITGFLIF